MSLDWKSSTHTRNLCICYTSHFFDFQKEKRKKFKLLTFTQSVYFSSSLTRYTHFPPYVPSRSRCFDFANSEIRTREILFPTNCVRLSICVCAFFILFKKENAVGGIHQTPNHTYHNQFSNNSSSKILNKKYNKNESYGFDYFNLFSSFSRLVPEVTENIQNNYI